MLFSLKHFSRLQRPILRVQPSEHHHRDCHHRRRPQHRTPRRLPRLLSTQTKTVVKEIGFGQPSLIQPPPDNRRAQQQQR
jgi:hypothetical protein